jgi:hypothetical protein
MLRRDRYEFHKKHTGTRYTKFVFLHLVGSVGYVVHSAHPGRETSEQYFSCSSGSGTDSTKSTTRHVTSNLYFCVQWDLRAQRAFCVSGVRNVDALFFIIW